jgi:hypothetical protein
MAIQFNTEFFKTFGKSFLPGELGVEILEVGRAR